MSQNHHRLPDTSFTGSESAFVRRHIGPRPEQIAEMLSFLGLRSLEELTENIVPSAIRSTRLLNLPEKVSEAQALMELAAMARKNRVFRSYIGLGFHDTITPGVILRNVMENPGWYTQYTPYQAEISQGRLEALVNFQTMIADLSGMEIANASMLDEGSSAAEAMMLCMRVRGSETKNKFFIAAECHPHVIEVVRTRAIPLGVETVIESIEQLKLDSSFFGVLVQYPTTEGKLIDYTAVAQKAHTEEALVVAACDLLSLVLFKPPGEWGADVAVGNSQRFGVPLGFGGPHAAFLATKDEFKRELPGRLVGVSKDSRGKPAYRLALQTREQHIRRDRATSNICTAQVLLAVMASMYAVYHGPKGLKQIAQRVHALTNGLRECLKKLGVKVADGDVFDTLRVDLAPDQADIVRSRAREAEINFRWLGKTALTISLNETTTGVDLVRLVEVLSGKADAESTVRAVIPFDKPLMTAVQASKSLHRSTSFLTHPVFNTYHSEHEMLRYLHRLQSRDLSLTASMIPLGSCTMKLNATSEMIPVTWPELANMHPFAPLEQAEGYLELIHDLERWLAEITGLDGVSLQPNAGSQGEYAGLLVIRAYHQSRKESNRTICLIPTSAHGTNPASAVMAGMKVVTVQCDSSGNIDVADLKAKAEEHKSNLAALMVTYPSTHGVFEESIKEICAAVHDNGGLVYMDGANMNAQVGVSRPGDFGVDVLHLNLHKTFCIPHGGGGPGVGPIAVKANLVGFLPSTGQLHVAKAPIVGPVCSAPWGSACILPIPWVYIRMMGAEGLKEATQVAMLNANYIARKLEPDFSVLYRGKQGFVAHECILDLRHFKRLIGIDVTDVAKRLMDYGFHAPTVSFPVVETLMVEPTESESLEELERFCIAMRAIRAEIREVEEGRADKLNNVLKNSPHTADTVCADEWTFPYTREKAAYPVPSLKEFKFWPYVSRIDNAWGDRNLFCACVPISGDGDV
ncbi:MAG: aminomethyl-transferring glycine dehydrogenase [Bdellovibrionota bacterium]